MEDSKLKKPPLWKPAAGERIVRKTVKAVEEEDLRVWRATQLGNGERGRTSTAGFPGDGTRRRGAH